jgi:hypothetical protein
MAKYKIVVHTSTNHYTYETNSDEARDRFIRLEKSRPEVKTIRVGWKYVYRK